MRLGIFPVLESHLYFFFCGLPLHDLCPFFYWIMIIFLLIHKSSLYIEGVDQWFIPSKAHPFFTSNNQLLLYRSPSSLSLPTYLSYCFLVYLPYLVYMDRKEGWESGLQGSILLNIQWVCILQDVYEENLKPERPFTCIKRLLFLLVDWRTLGGLVSCSLTINWCPNSTDFLNLYL